MAVLCLPCEGIPGVEFNIIDGGICRKDYAPLSNGYSIVDYWHLRSSDSNVVTE